MKPMKMILKISVLAPAVVLAVIAEVPPELPSLQVELVREAHAILGVRRRSVAVGYAAGATEAKSQAATTQQAATAQQQQATAQQQQATAQQQQATAQQQATIAQQQQAAAQRQPAAAAPLPLGTVVTSLPPGCTPTPIGGVEYQYCGGNFYHAAFQGSNLVYVTARP